ncbi:MAG TPA: glutamate--tRNA ligase family protein [Lacibacter sp.]|nr:glutamate--tRNA ligase family protein [Lacibacter sp.]HMO87665.1 glutamate--tRNA ligase family protein [Lacibacter sp.]
MPLTPAFTRTRLAPTPSGYLHLGNVASFVLTAGLARRSGASILLRIDDLDRERVRDHYLEDIFDTLLFLDIPWDEGPRSANEHRQLFTQSTRMQAYADALDYLRATGAIFACNCSRSALAAQAGSTYPGTCLHRGLPPEQPGVNWRLHTERSGGITWQDMRQGPTQLPLPPDMHFFMVRRKNGYPSYQLASVVDDLYFNVDLVVRGADLLPSTLAQQWLAGHLPANRFSATTFVHHPLLHAPGGTKLSKSAGDTSVYSLRKTGHAAAGIYRLVASACGSPEQPGSWEELFDVLEPLWLTGGGQG